MPRFITAALAPPPGPAHDSYPHPGVVPVGVVGTGPQQLSDRVEPVLGTGLGVAAAGRHAEGPWPRPLPPAHGALVVLAGEVVPEAVGEGGER